jgi:hypothetical protein
MKGTCEARLCRNCLHIPQQSLSLKLLTYCSI